MKRCKFLTLMLALLLLLQSSALAADKGKTVTVTLPTFAVTLNDTKIDSAHSEYPLIVYRDITYFPMTYHASRFLHLKSNWYQTEPKGTLFVGYSDASEDMAAREVGMDVFLLTDCLINAKNRDLNAYPRGDFAALNAYIDALQ